jgi:hypothetical protein
MVSALRKFDEFLSPLWTRGIPSHVTLHSLVQDLLENKTLDLTTQLQWELSQKQV